MVRSCNKQVKDLKVPQFAVDAGCSEPKSNVHFWERRESSRAIGEGNQTKR